MDNLRAFAMLAGVLFHAGLAYSPLAQPFFPTADRQNAFGMDVWLWFLHLFRMPLFFLLSGYLCAALIERRGVGGFLVNRFKRIALPFLLFWPVVYFVLKYSTESAALNAQQPSPLLVFIRPYLLSTDAVSVPPTTSHLWFLYYLIIFSLLTWSGKILGTGKMLAWFIARKPIWHWTVFPLLLIPALYSVSAPHPAPESFFPQFWALGFYGLFFAYGIGLNGRKQVDALSTATITCMLIGACLLYILFLHLVTRQSGMGHDAETSSGAIHAVIATLEAYISVWMSLVALDLGRTFLNRSSRWLGFLSDASYWTYIVHLPILFLIQYPLMDWNWVWQAKFVLACVVCLLISLLSYRWLVRTTLLDRWLGGRSHAQAIRDIKT